MFSDKRNAIPNEDKLAAFVLLQFALKLRGVLYSAAARDKLIDLRYSLK